MLLLAMLALALGAQDGEPVWVLAGTHPYVVNSASMEPSLREGDVIVANRPRGDCGTTTPAIGDIVVVDRDGVPWIQRVVAGPGQTVQMVGGVLTIDGRPVEREEVGRSELPGGSATIWRETAPGGRPHLTFDFGPNLDLDETPVVVVPDGHWFAMGDSRDNAVDDRISGPTPASHLCGIVLRVVRSDDPAKVGTRP
jgi:signal peptidase I